jgi:hypothetical protein
LSAHPLEEETQLHESVPIWSCVPGEDTLHAQMGLCTCCVLMSTPESQQPKPGWLWYQPTTISGLQEANMIKNTITIGSQKQPVF